MGPVRAAKPVSAPTRIPSLDGLRALSILLVLLGHLDGTVGYPVPPQVSRFFALGALGVRVFFVISGFLITSLLLEEREKMGRIHLGRFYLRRTLRIFPPYYVFLAATALAAAFGVVQLNPGDLLHGATFTSNYHLTRSWVVGHTWSLGVEEQFYLVWPAMLIALGVRRGPILAAAFLAFAPVIRLAIWYALPTWHDGIGITFGPTGDAIAAGCLLAIGRKRLWGHSAYRSLLSSPWFILVPITIAAASAFADRPRISYAVAFSVMNIGIAMCLDWCIRNPDGRVGGLLNARPIVFVGVISYSIYLWQQPFLNAHAAAVATTFPINIALVAIASLASYYCVERPFLRFRRRIESSPRTLLSSRLS